MPCHTYRSRIVYADKGAGIRDRLQVMEALGKLAISLCALLAMDPPCRALKRGHNRGKEVSCNWTWSHYVQLTHDGMDVLNSTLPPAPFLKLGSENASSDLMRARRSRGQPFVWEFPYFHAAVRHVLIPQVRMEVVWARNFSEVADRLLQTLPKLFTTLHIRRRDTAEECDTSVVRVLAYVNCSVEPSTALFFYTDDRSKDYINPLQKGLSKVRGLFDPVHKTAFNMLPLPRSFL